MSKTSQWIYKEKNNKTSKWINLASFYNLVSTQKTNYFNPTSNKCEIKYLKIKL